MALCCLLFVLLHVFETKVLATIKFTSPYQGQTIRGTAGTSVNFTWRFSGNVRAVSWGIKKADSQNIFEGNSPLLTLDISGNPTFTHQGYTGRVSGSRTGNSSSAQVIFTLSSITIKDAKPYLCILEAGFGGSAQYDYVQLVVKDPPSITQPISANASYNERSPVTISCTATGTPDPDVKWFRNTQVKSSGVKKADLTFSSISKADAGKYTCRANNSVGSDVKQLELIVKFPAKIQSLTGNLTVNERDPMELRCDVSGYPAPTITWKKNGQQIQSTGEKLHINISRRSDTGTYVCIADNGVGQTAQMKTFVTVNYQATIHNISSSVSKSWIGRTVTLTCNSDGVPTPTLWWYKPDGTKFNSAKAKENTVSVTMNSDEDFGLYNCTADNGFVPASMAVFVHQIKAPGSPIITSKDENIQANFMSVKWDPPADNGGSPITAYRVVILQSDVEIRDKNVTNSATRALRIENLKKSTNYTVKVFARNYVFEGKAIEKTFQTRFKGIPAAVDSIVLPADAKEGNVTIKWNTPKDSGDPITQYTVYQRTVSDDGTPQQWIKIKEITELSNRVVVVPLKKGKKYEFVVTATNGEGESFIENDKIKRISVGDIPEAVVITDEVNDVEITLTWEEPDNNGADITQYDVYQGIVNDEWKNIGTIMNTSKREFVFEGKKGEEYKFSVTATNKYGESSKEDSSTIVKVPGVFTAPTESRAGSSCDDEKKTLHAVYMTVILLLLISNFVLIYLLWRMRSRSENLERNKECQTCGDVIAMNPILKTVQVEADTQSSSVAQKIDAPTYAAPIGADYMPLNPSTKNWEISREQVNIIKVIGKGAFSKVAQATVGNIRGSQECTTVAVKMLKANAPASDRKDLLSELELMKKLKPNPHVIKLIGCVTECDPLLVLIEYVPFGDLLGYLRKSRGLNDTYFKDPDVKPQSSLTAEQLMKFAWQVADGMFYLSSKKIIHRDLAARNVLVGEGEKCKVTDFGMARNVQQDDIYNRTSRGRLPVKWTAYEALMYGTYTTQSDVWSFGVLLYEILTVGGSPYPEINPREIARKLQEGYRMPKPRHVEDKLYQIMLRCWEENPLDRPTFDKLRKTMKEMERNHKTYVNLNQYDHSLYANVQDLTAE